MKARIFRIDVRAIMTLMGNWRGHDCVCLPVLKGLPDGYDIRAVAFNFGHNAFELLVTHESFPEVPDGDLIPLGNGGRLAECEAVRIAVANADAATADNLRFDVTMEGVCVGVASVAPMPSGPKKRWEFLGAPQ
jgi:hypothetical protein